MRETHNIEFKQKLTDSFLKTVSVFGNYGDGKIYFGIDDSCHTVGVKNPKEDCLRIENSINDSLNPIPDFREAIYHFAN